MLYWNANAFYLTTKGTKVLMQYWNADETDAAQTRMKRIFI
jgi:hypothetical protein